MMSKNSFTLLTRFLLLNGARSFTLLPQATTRGNNVAFQATTRTTSCATRREVSSTATDIGASTELLSMINSQVTNELSASQLYLSASIWCENQDLSGMANYMRSESAEERSHALGFIDFANNRSFPITLEALEAPDSSWGSVQELWESLLLAEEKNTKNLLELADVAVETGDHATTAFLLPYHSVRSK